MQNRYFRIFLGCLAGTFLLLLRHGYSFGSGDQSEMLPYSKYLTDNQLYASDFYIQSIASSVPNERYVFSWFLSLFGDKMDWAVFGLHFLTTMLLILGLYRLAEKGLATEGGRWLATLAPVMLFYGINLGGNELYYNTFLPSYVAQVIGVWVFVAALKNQFFVVYCLLMMATYIHPLIGVQLWLLITLAYIALFLLERKFAVLANVLAINVLYIATAGFFVYKIKSGYDAGGVSAQQFFDIIEFRAAHHYFPHTFPLKNWFILALPFFIGWVTTSNLVWFVFRGIVLGAVVYLVGVYFLKNPTPLSTQWFSTTVWLKMFSFFITISFIEKMMEKKIELKNILESKYWIYNGFVVIIQLSIILMLPQFQIFKHKPYEFPFYENKTPEVAIAQLAKEKTPFDALFLIPSDLSEFRFWSERSSFVDYKATNHRQSVFVDWYDHIQKVYKISLSDRLNGANLTALANQHFQELTEQDFAYFAKNQHITHIVTYKNVVLNFPKIAENEAYIIYQLPHSD